MSASKGGSAFITLTVFSVYRHCAIGQPGCFLIVQRADENPESQTWLERVLVPGLDICFLFIEGLTVVGVSIVVLLATVYEVRWILWGDVFLKRQTRMQEALSALNANWKLGLILLIPLFYRTTRVILEKAEKIGPIEKPRPPKAVGPVSKNPTPESDGQDGE